VQPICFMVTPYGRKKTDAPAGQGPAEINYDALWDKALRPAIEALGYEPVRADQEVGALIIHEMLERLYFSDLVLAEMTIPNGNVYYEVGIRHACKQKGCVLLAADWSKPLFDVAQMRTVRYPLPEGEIADATAQGVREAIAAKVSQLAAGASPMYEVLPGFPDDVDPSRAGTMRKQLEALSAFQAKAVAVRAAPKAERSQRALALAAEYGKPPIAGAVAHGLLKLFENVGEWQAIVDLVAKLPDDVAHAPETVELVNLARSKLGNHLDAIGALEALIATAGPTSEREGLIGGRYKRLYNQATDPVDKARYLNEAIVHYERGMMLDLNDFYPSSNLPGLYRERASKGDDEKAAAAAQLVVYACARTKQREPNQPWVRQTLLVAAFDAGNVDAAESLYGEILAEGPAAWQLASTLDDLKRSLKRVADPARRDALQGVYDQLAKLA